MKKNQKYSIAAGIVLFILAALFSISLLVVAVDFGGINPVKNTVFYTLGKMFTGVYGFSSAFIPIFFIAAGVQCFDTVYTNLNDMEGFRRDVETIHTMGFDRKSIVNPRQIPIVHEIFTPKQKDIIFAEKVVREIDTKKAQGIGVFTVDGKMIDIAFYDGAKRTLALARASGVYKGDL